MNICRTRFKKEIITEFVPPANLKSRKVMIFCSGIPGAPYKDDVLDFWAKRGFWTFFPRYRGTWESGGVFLSKSLEIDVLDVIDGFSNRFQDYWSGKTYKVIPKFITVVGSSFGGPAAILASRDERVNKAVCISPVVDWVEENKSDPLNQLYSFIREAYGEAYRLHKGHWNKLSRGHFYNPVKHINEIDGHKIFIIHAKDDKIVRFKPVEKFSVKSGSHLLALKRGGHLSSSMLIEKRYYQKIKKFLYSKAV